MRCRTDVDSNDVCRLTKRRIRRSERTIAVTTFDREVVTDAFRVVHRRSTFRAIKNSRHEINLLELGIEFLRSETAESRLGEFPKLLEKLFVGRGKVEARLSLHAFFEVW